MPVIKTKLSLTAASFIAELTALRKNFSSDNSRNYTGIDKKTKLLNVRMNAIFSLAKKYTQLSPDEIVKLFKSEYYEVRVGAVSIMDFIARNPKSTTEIKKVLYDIYIKNNRRINNWDMVDRVAPHIVGGYLFNKSRKPLYDLAKSKDPLQRRTAIVATWYMIRKGEVDDTFKIAEILVNDKDELVHKAVGSWVREAGKRDKIQLLSFLEKHAATMPRISLRYAIEKLNQKQKKYFMDAGESKH